MSVSLWVGNRCYEIGSTSLLKAFFSTIYVRLEDERWGSDYPAVMRELYQGTLQYQRCGEAIRELRDIRENLKGFAPDQVVWDFENRSTAPPWGTDISPAITSLADYFRTSDGKGLIEVLLGGLEEAKDKKRHVRIQ